MASAAHMGKKTGYQRMRRSLEGSAGILQRRSSSSFQLPRKWESEPSLNAIGWSLQKISLLNSAPGHLSKSETPFPKRETWRIEWCPWPLSSRRSFLDFPCNTSLKKNAEMPNEETSLQLMSMSRGEERLVKGSVIEERFPESREKRER
ncbi:hypothetical protein OXYTRIMIC_226 [Oxytricha trifallax]|uniref:Uncharacterized protein n=1 Tax=Oxytricha trifallax TaxID=1172189 RepID=A0A073I053_9SPIT|nr:hypothetical protein OXYTRIMIC_226 [Oxytricha trifallax]